MKKLLLIAIVASLPAMAFSQAGRFVVEGNLKGYQSPTKAYLQYRDKVAMYLDSVIVDSGKFRFEGGVPTDPIMAWVMISKNGTPESADESRQVFLDIGTVTIIGDKLHGANITGEINVANAELDKMRDVLNSYYDRLATLSNTAHEDKSVAHQQEVEKVEAELIQRERDITKKFIQNHPDSYISLVALGSYAYEADYNDLVPLFDGLTDRVKQTVRGKHFADLLSHIKAVSIGAIAPDFAEPDTTGKMVSLSSFRGKYVLVDFWASWCGPCRAENPNVLKAYNQYKGKNFTVLGVSLDPPDGKGRWIAAINKDGLPWTQVSDLKYWDSEAASLYGVKAIPQNFLLDPKGKIIAKNLRDNALQSELEQVLGKMINQ